MTILTSCFYLFRFFGFCAEGFKIATSSRQKEAPAGLKHPNMEKARDWIGNRLFGFPKANGCQAGRLPRQLRNSSGNSGQVKGETPRLPPSCNVGWCFLTRSWHKKTADCGFSCCIIWNHFVISHPWAPIHSQQLRYCRMWHSVLIAAWNDLVEPLSHKRRLNDTKTIQNTPPKRQAGKKHKSSGLRVSTPGPHVLIKMLRNEEALCQKSWWPAGAAG